MWKGFDRLNLLSSFMANADNPRQFMCNLKKSVYGLCMESVCIPGRQLCIALSHLMQC